MTNWSHGDIPWDATPNEWDVISYWLVMYRDEVYAVSNREDDDD
jgi:hypothetical protein